MPLGAVSAVRQLTGLYGTGTELGRAENAFAVKTLNGVSYPFPARTTA